MSPFSLNNRFWFQFWEGNGTDAVWISVTQKWMASGYSTAFEDYFPLAN
jgi:hypothetical protein